MANDLFRQITHEGPRNVIVTFSGVLDTSDISLRPAISIEDCKSNRELSVLSGFRVDWTDFSISSPMEIILEWNSSAPQLILALTGRSRTGGINYTGLIPQSDRVGYDGSINLKTNGQGSSLPGSLSVPKAFTITMELVKIYK